ncbi:MAG: DsbA family protein [Candidatus Kerfeldbacteria bacterium]|nr:DsbA family protein [Candidatus Kerfeldbacteria bacterium]
MDTPTPVKPNGMFEGSSPKLTFIFGIILGVAATAVIGLVLVLPKAYGSTKNKTADTTTTSNTNTTAPAQTFSDVKAVSDDDYIRGNKNAKLTLIEYSDYECPFCKQFEPTIKQVMKDYGDQVRLVYRQFPLSFHANAQKESEAALCIGKLGGNDKFWDFTDAIFERTSSNGTGFALDQLGPLAKELGVNQTKFQACLDSNEMAQVVKDQEADGTAGGAQGTPSVILVNSATGKTLGGIPGAYPLDQVKTFIDDALAKI